MKLEKEVEKSLKTLSNVVVTNYQYEFSPRGIVGEKIIKAEFIANDDNGNEIQGIVTYKNYVDNPLKR